MRAMLQGLARFRERVRAKCARIPPRVDLRPLQI